MTVYKIPMSFDLYSDRKPNRLTILKEFITGWKYCGRVCKGSRIGIYQCYLRASMN